MAHDLKDKAGLAAPSSDGPTATKSRSGAAPHASRARSGVSARRDAMTKPVSRLSQASDLGVHEASPCDRQQACNSLGAMMCKLIAAPCPESMMAQAMTQPAAQDRTRIDKLVLAAGLMDHQLEVLTAESMGVDHAKLRRLADKDPSLVPVIGRGS